MGRIIEIPEEPEKGPWEGWITCYSCNHGLSGDEYYSNDSVGPHCGIIRQGLARIARRRVFLEPESPQWRRRLRKWLMLEERERPFKWEVKE